MPSYKYGVINSVNIVLMFRTAKDTLKLKVIIILNPFTMSLVDLLTAMTTFSFAQFKNIELGLGKISTF